MISNLGSTAASGIGSLLRLIEEEKANQAANMQANTETGTPLREAVSTPLAGPEDPGTNRVIAMKPEGVIGTEASPVTTQGATPARSMIGPPQMGGPGEEGILPVGPASSTTQNGVTVATAPYISPDNVPTPSGPDPNKPTTGSAEGDWSKYHGGEGNMPAGYHGEGGGQPNQAPSAAPTAAPIQNPVQASIRKVNQPSGVVLGTQVSGLTPEQQQELKNYGDNIDAQLNAIMNKPYTSTPETKQAAQIQMAKEALQKAAKARSAANASLPTKMTYSY